MNATVITLLDSAKARMSAYAALLNYRYMNLSVKAEPAALLSFTVNVAGAEWPLEKAARVRNAPGREDQFEIYPNSADLATPILKGLFSAHPEYKTEIKHSLKFEKEIDEISATGGRRFLSPVDVFTSWCR